MNRTTTPPSERSVFARGDKEKARRRRVHHHRVRFEQLESRLLLAGDPCEPNADSGEGGTVSSGVHVCASAGGPELTEVTIDEGESASFTIHHTDGDGDPSGDPSYITVGYTLLGSSAVLDVDYDASPDLQVAFDTIDVPWNGSVTINIDTLLDDLIEGVENVRFNLVQVPNNGPQSADILIVDKTPPPQGNLTLTLHNGEIVSEENEDDESENVVPTCGCVSTLTVDSLNDTAKAGTVTLIYDSSILQIRRDDGSAIPSGSVIDPDGNNSLEVVGVGVGVGIIALTYSGSGGFQTLDSIAATGIDSSFDIDIRVAAFIPKSKGRAIEWAGFIPSDPTLLDVRWSDEPIPINVNNPTFFFATDNRENAGEEGTSRIAVNGVLDVGAIGQLQGTGPIFNVEESSSHRVLVHQEGIRAWADGRTVQTSTQIPNKTETISDLGGFRSQFTVVASASYPFAPLGAAPNIDFEVTFTVERLEDCSVSVSFVGVHDEFPAYEVMVNDEVLHSYLAPGEVGPGLINLNTTMAISGSTTVSPPTGDEDE